MSIQSNKRASELEKQLRVAKEGYYNLYPNISDQEYDALRDELKLICPDSKEISNIGAESPKISVWDKVKHQIPMGSLDKVNSIKEFEEWVDKIQNTSYLFTHKIDGSSMELIYEEGKLIRCSTRGDGKIGEDVTENIIKVPNIPKKISSYEDTAIRGEIVMMKSIFFEKYSDKYANPRNTAAGKVRSKKDGGEGCKDLSFIAYTIISSQSKSKESDRFLELSNIGFLIPEYSSGSSEEAKLWYENVSKSRENIPYEIDGIVVRVEDIIKQEGLGSHNMRPVGQKAWKFDPAMGVTTIIGVKWQVGTTGRITPVAKVVPVSIGGVTISSISLHNLSMFKKLELRIGSKILVSRRNDVIPYIEKNLSL